MPKWLKILLLVAALVFLSFFAMCGACAYVGYDTSKAIIEQAPKAVAEGERDALDFDQAACMDRALDKGMKCEEGGPLEAGKCQALTKIYAKACLGHAKKTEAFCEGLPDGSSIMKMAAWAVQRCADLGREQNQTCAQIVQVVLEHCGVVFGAAAFGQIGGPTPQSADPEVITAQPPPKKAKAETVQKTKSPEPADQK